MLLQALPISELTHLVAEYEEDRDVWELQDYTIEAFESIAQMGDHKFGGPLNWMAQGMPDLHILGGWLVHQDEIWCLKKTAVLAKTEKPWSFAEWVISLECVYGKHGLLKHSIPALAEFTGTYFDCQNLIHMLQNREKGEALSLAAFLRDVCTQYHCKFFYGKSGPWWNRSSCFYKQLVRLAKTK